MICTAAANKSKTPVGQLAGVCFNSIKTKEKMFPYSADKKQEGITTSCLAIKTNSY
jgi:hypothetical protein